MSGCGCSICKESKLEKELNEFLTSEKIEVIRQANKIVFPWLHRQSLDFYLPQYNIAVECQGKQHFGVGGWIESFSEIKERDERKRKLCEENGVKLLYYSNLNIEYPYEVITDKNNLLKIIKSYEK